MIIEVLYSDISYDYIIGNVIHPHTNAYVCVFIPDLCKGTDWIASLDTFYINEPNNECMLYVQRENIEFSQLPHLLPFIGNAQTIWDIIHLREPKIKMTCSQKNVRHLLESIGKRFGKTILWCDRSDYHIEKSFSMNNLMIARKLLDILSATDIHSNIEYIDARFTQNYSNFKDPPVQTRFFKILKHF